MQRDVNGKIARLEQHCTLQVKGMNKVGGKSRSERGRWRLYVGGCKGGGKIKTDARQGVREREEERWMGWV